MKSIRDNSCQFSLKKNFSRKIDLSRLLSDSIYLRVIELFSINIRGQKLGKEAKQNLECQLRLSNNLPVSYPNALICLATLPKKTMRLYNSLILNDQQIYTETKFLWVTFVTGLALTTIARQESRIKFFVGLRNEVKQKKIII